MNRPEQPLSPYGTSQSRTIQAVQRSWPRLTAPPAPRHAPRSAPRHGRRAPLRTISLLPAPHAPAIALTTRPRRPGTTSVEPWTASMRYRLATPTPTETFRQPTDLSSGGSKATAVPRQIATAPKNSPVQTRSNVSRPLRRNHATGHQTARVHLPRCCMRTAPGSTLGASHRDAPSRQTWRTRGRSLGLPFAWADSPVYGGKRALRAPGAASLQTCHDVLYHGNRYVMSRGAKH